MANEYVEVERESADTLTKWQWRFWFYQHTLWLDSYVELQRATRRHGFKITETYSRVMDRGNTMKVDDVVLPSTITDAAIKKFCEGITVKRWSK